MDERCAQSILRRCGRHPASAQSQCIAATRRGGTVSVPGVYTGFIHGFLFGDAFDKGLTSKMGQTHVQRFMPELLEAIGGAGCTPKC